MHDLIHNFWHPEAKLETLAMPSTLKIEDRERFEEVHKAESVSTLIHNACRALKEEMQSCFFTLRSSNSRMVQLAVRIQTDGCQGYVDQ
jgi:hypothetical protein